MAQRVKIAKAYRPSQRRKRKRESTAERGYGNKWQVYTQRFKAKWPACSHCLRLSKWTGCLYDAKGEELPNNIDHIEPVSGPSDPRFWDEYNHQNLCHKCHAKKTAQQGKGEYDTTQDLLDRALQLANQPMTPIHR